MSHTPRTLEEKMVSAKPAELSATEEASILAAVRERVSGMPVRSPFIPSLIAYPKAMIPIILLLALTLGAGGTVAASDNARPGDILFPLDRAIEDFRLSLASEDGKNDLRIKFASERLKEFNEIAGDEDEDVSGELLEAEADIFTDETVVKLETANRKVTFITDADTREEIIDVIVDRYGFSEEEVDAVLVIETEDRDSTPEDRDEDEKRNERLGNALDVLGDFIEKNRDAASSSPGVLNALAIIEDRILERSSFFPEQIRVKVRDDRARYEVRGSNGERVRVEIKDGEVRVKTKDDDDDDRDDDRDDDDRDDENLEIEADVFTDLTTVKVELNGRKTTFTTSADTREEIIDAIQARFGGLSESEIDEALEIEFEDRASREGDQDEDEDENEDEDEDEDDDDSSNDDSDDDDDRDDDSNGRTSLEVEARIRDGRAEIEVELNDVKTKFNANVTTRSGVIAAVASRFPALSTSQIDAALELEFKN